MTYYHIGFGVGYVILKSQKAFIKKRNELNFSTNDGIFLFHFG